MPIGKRTGPRSTRIPNTRSRDEPCFFLLRPRLDPGGICVRIHNALDGLTDHPDLRLRAVARIGEGRDILNELSRPENRQERVFMRRVCRDVLAVRGLRYAVFHSIVR